MFKKKIIAALAVSLVVGSLGGMTASAAPVQVSLPEPAEFTVDELPEETLPDEEALPDEETSPDGEPAETDSGIIYVDESWDGESDELFASYVESVFGLDQTAMCAVYSAGDNLDDSDRELYNYLKPLIAEVANSGGSTVFKVPKSYIGLEDDDIDGFLEKNGIELGKSTLTEVNQKLNELFGADIVRVYNSLLADMPYEFYWKYKQYGYRKSFFVDKYVPMPGNKDVVKSVTSLVSPVLMVSVDSAYRQDKSEDYEVSGDVSKVQKAYNKALEIAEKGSRKDSDYSIVSYFKRWIRDNADYYYEQSPSEYGDPWQMIYVFDGDKKTKVTCEGYSKAFKFLCDRADFSSDTECIAVRGYLDREGHMWNIVRLEGNNYLVDLTNSRKGGVARGNELFMAGTSMGNVDDGYYLSVNDFQILYKYANTGDSGSGATYSQLELFGREWLTLASDNYDYKDEPDDPEDDDDDKSSDKEKKSSGKKGESTPAYLATASKDTAAAVMAYLKAADRKAYVAGLSPSMRQDGAKYSYPMFQSCVVYDMEKAAAANAIAAPAVPSAVFAGVPSGVTIDAGNWISFNREALSAIEKSNVNVTVIYRTGQAVKSFVIPAGYKVTELANADGYAGFEYIRARIQGL